MDALSHVLAGPSARGAFVLRSSLDPPWSMRIEDESPLSVITILRGEAYVCPAGAEPALIRAGDVAIARGPRHYTVADQPGTEPQVLIGPGQTCTMLTGDVPRMTDVGVRTWGNATDGATLMLNGTYESRSMVGRRLLDTLPDLIVAPRDHVPVALIDYLGVQATDDAPGQDAVLDRMLDLILIAVLRWWFASHQAGWFKAQTDPVIGRALRLMQDAPDESWTVARLGHETGLSRAAFARRFTELVGEPPMAFLTGWRLSLAADLLGEPGATVTSVARRVGYGTPYAFSTAFKRFHAVSPQQHRERTLSTG